MEDLGDKDVIGDMLFSFSEQLLFEVLGAHLSQVPHWLLVVHC